MPELTDTDSTPHPANDQSVVPPELAPSVAASLAALARAADRASGPPAASSRPPEMPPTTAFTALPALTSADELAVPIDFPQPDENEINMPPETDISPEISAAKTSMPETDMTGGLAAPTGLENTDAFAPLPQLDQRVSATSAPTIPAADLTPPGLDNTPIEFTRPSAATPLVEPGATEFASNDPNGIGAVPHATNGLSHDDAEPFSTDPTDFTPVSGTAIDTDAIEAAAAKVAVADSAAPELFETTPLPPFSAPHPHERASEKKRPVGIIAFAILASIAALALAWFWSSANSRATEADRDTAAAITERDAATQTLLANEVELQTLRDDLATARTDLETANALAAKTPDLSAEVTELETTITGLETEIGELRTENTELISDLEAAETPAVDPLNPDAAETADREVAEPAPAPEPTPAPAGSFDASTTPEFARYIGESLSSRNGTSRLGQAQSECFGAAVIGEVGLDGLGAGLNNAATRAANNAVVGAMQSAASTCNIDPSLIFG